LDKPSIFNVKKKAAESTAKANRLATSAGSSAGIRRSNDGKANGKAGKSKSTTNTKTKSNNVTDAADGPEKKKPKKPRATPKCQFYNRAFEESRMLSDALLPGDNRLYEYEAASNSSCDTYLGTWKVFMLLDFREFGQATKGKKAGKNCFIHLAEARINRHFGEKCCENMHLQCADYMFVARLISKADNETILDERVLDLIVERKDVNDLCSCLILPSKSHPPLQFFEAQMYKLQHCGLENKVFLLEGDENDRRQFNMRASETKIDKSGNRYRKFGTASREEQIRRLKRVKTIRNQMICGEFKGVRIVCTKDREDTVLWLIQQFELIRKSFDPAHPPWRVKSEFDDYVKAQMKDDTFQEYLRLLSMEKIGDKKAMRIIKDPCLKWDKTFISPREAQSIDTSVHSKLGDKPIFWNPDNPPVEHARVVRAILQRSVTAKSKADQSSEPKMAEQSEGKSNPVTPLKTKQDGRNMNDDSSSSGSSMNGDSNLKKVPSGECDESIIDLLDDESDAGDDDADTGVIVID